MCCVVCMFECIYYGESFNSYDYGNKCVCTSKSCVCFVFQCVCESPIQCVYFKVIFSECVCSRLSKKWDEKGSNAIIADENCSFWAILLSKLFFLAKVQLLTLFLFLSIGNQTFFLVLPFLKILFLSWTLFIFLRMGKGADSVYNIGNQLN